MKYNVSIPSLSVKDVITEIDNRLANIEVKGDSVIYLSQVRGMIKNLYDVLEEIPDEQKGDVKNDIP